MSKTRTFELTEQEMADRYVESENKLRAYLEENKDEEDKMNITELEGQ